MFLVSDIFSDDLFVQSDRANAIPSCPKTITGQILGSTKASPMDQNRRLAFQLPNCMGHTILGWDSQTQVDVIRHSMAFDQVDFEPPTKFLQYFPNLFPDPFRKGLFPVLWDKHDVVSAVPSNMCLCFPFLHKLFLVDRQADTGRAFLTSLATLERSNLFGSRRQRRRFNCLN